MQANDRQDQRRQTVIGCPLLKGLSDRRQHVALCLLFLGDACVEEGWSAVRGAGLKVYSQYFRGVMLKDKRNIVLGLKKSLGPHIIRGRLFEGAKTVGGFASVVQAGTQAWGACTAPHLVQKVRLSIYLPGI